MIIGIAGKLGTGKNYYSRFILEYIRTYYPQEHIMEIAFADQIKVNTIVKNGLSRDHVYTNKTMESRRLLQMEGTENGRNKLGPNIWINYTKEWMYLLKQRGIKHFVITDIRFKNETSAFNYDLLFNVFSSVRNQQRLDKEYTPEQQQLIKKHISECALDDYSFEETLFNDPENDTEKNKTLLKQYIDIILGYSTHE